MVYELPHTSALHSVQPLSLAVVVQKMWCPCDFAATPWGVMVYSLGAIGPNFLYLFKDPLRSLNCFV